MITFIDKDSLIKFFNVPRNQELLNKKDFDSLYKLYHVNCNQLTQLFIMSQVDFLPYLSELYEFHYWGVDLQQKSTTLVIPNNIKRLNSSSLGNLSFITTLVLPKLQYMGDNVFLMSNFKTIKYEGQTLEWISLCHNSESDLYDMNVIVQCKDDDLHYYLEDGQPICKKEKEDVILI